MTTDNPSGIIIRMRDVRRAKMCANGTRGWFEQLGLDYGKFLAEGAPIELVETIDDEMARQVCAIARKFHEEGGTE